MKSIKRGPGRGKEGSTVILVAVAMVVLLGMAALAVDIGYFYVIRNELQNAADSGALAGAQVLYNNNGTQVNAGANQTATDYVHEHYSENAAVTIQSVDRGHWSFATRTFTPNTSLNPVDLWNQTTEQLDANLDFINAVRVITTRTLQADGQPASPFFGRILGLAGPVISTSAVAYIGFTGTIDSNKVDQPIAICKQSLLDANGVYTCGVGRMINSGATEGHQTGGWTNFTQSPCDTASSSSVAPLVCSTGNAGALIFGQGMGTNGGQIQNAFTGIDACWRNYPGLDTNGDGIPDQPWKLTLPVVDCPGNNTSNCSTLVGAVTVNVVWITETDKNQMNQVPRAMGAWTCPSTSTGQQCWDSFVSYFGLKDVLNATPAIYEDKTIYFLPDCTPHETVGTTGGENFGMLAQIPVLVK